MRIRIRLLGGPLHGQAGATSFLDKAKVFFNERDRVVMLYVRENEVDYLYHPDMSKGLTEKYDLALARFNGNPQSVFFNGEPEAPEPLEEETKWTPPSPEAFLPPAEWTPDDAEPESWPPSDEE